MHNNNKYQLPKEEKHNFSLTQTGGIWRSQDHFHLTHPERHDDVFICCKTPAGKFVFSKITAAMSDHQISTILNQQVTAEPDAFVSVNDMCALP